MLRQLPKSNMGESVPATKREILEATRETIEESFVKYFLQKSRIKTGHLVLSKLFPYEYAIRSSVGGLETSLGTQFWERLAKRLALLNGFKVLDEKVELQRPSPMPSSIQNLIGTWEGKREDSSSPVSMADYVFALNKKTSSLKTPTKFKKLQKGTGIDLYLRKGRTDYAFDIKTVQINSGSGPKFNQTLMKWHAYHALKWKGSKNFKALIAFPYDPTPDGAWWSKFASRAAPLNRKDAYVAGDFWDFITGKPNTLNYITDAINKLSTSHFPVIYRNVLVSPRKNHDCEIIKFHFECNRVNQKKDSNGKKKWFWECSICHSKFEKSIPKIKKDLFACPKKCRSLA